MTRFTSTQSLRAFQQFIGTVYGEPDDRLFSVSDLLSNQERFTMRALKGIRKKDRERLRLNLLISFSWLMAVANRLHVDLDEATWRRFPNRCSYCGQQPCACKRIKPTRRARFVATRANRPRTLAQFQTMFNKIYPATSRTLADAGVHLAEEMGEVSEAIHVFLGEHKQRQFVDIINELADFVSCIFGVANSGRVNIAQELGKMYRRGCHICHKAPCACKFSFVAKYRS